MKGKESVKGGLRVSLGRADDQVVAPTYGNGPHRFAAPSPSEVSGMRWPKMGFDKYYRLQFEVPVLRCNRLLNIIPRLLIVVCNVSINWFLIMVMVCDKRVSRRYELKLLSFTIRV